MLGRSSLGDHSKSAGMLLPGHRECRSSSAVDSRRDSNVDLEEAGFLYFVYLHFSWIFCCKRRLGRSGGSDDTMHVLFAKLVGQSIGNNPHCIVEKSLVEKTDRLC